MRLSVLRMYGIFFFPEIWFLKWLISYIISFSVKYMLSGSRWKPLDAAMYSLPRHFPPPYYIYIITRVFLYITGLGLSFNYFYNQIVNMECPNAPFSTWPTFYTFHKNIWDIWDIFFNNICIASHNFILTVVLWPSTSNFCSLYQGNSSGFVPFNPGDNM